MTSSAKSGQLAHRMRESLERTLQYGAGSAADLQRKRSDKLERQTKELKEHLPTVCRAAVEHGGELRTLLGSAPAHVLVADCDGQPIALAVGPASPLVVLPRTTATLLILYNGKTQLLYRERGCE